MAQNKTNAMRILESKKIPYQMHHYDSDGAIDAVSVSQKIGKRPQQVFKTLVTKGKSGGYFVFVIPASAELDLKAAAKAVKEKSVEMIAVKDINKVTGYIRGGCSPIGMKKLYTTVIDESALQEETIIVSAGKIGSQIETAPQLLAQAAAAKFEFITADHEEVKA